MQKYLELNIKIEPLQPWNEILMAELINIGFDSFTEENDGILAYVPEDSFSEEELKNLWLLSHDEVKISYTIQEMPNINWNEEWEKNFSPINVENKVLIRAEFHESQNTLYEIIIQPKMSFGTGHHATTYLMIQQMLDMDFSGKKVLDIGCGTSILGSGKLQRKYRKKPNEFPNRTRNSRELGQGKFRYYFSEYQPKYFDFRHSYLCFGFEQRRKTPAFRALFLRCQ